MPAGLSSRFSSSVNREVSFFPDCQRNEVEDWEPEETRGRREPDVRNTMLDDERPRRSRTDGETDSEQRERQPPGRRRARAGQRALREIEFEIKGPLATNARAT